MNLYIFYSQNKYLDRERNFKLSDDNYYKIGTTEKVKPFQRKKNMKIRANL